MEKQTTPKVPKLKFNCEHPFWFVSKEMDHITDPDNKDMNLCGTKKKGQDTTETADWETLHGGYRYINHKICPKCKEKAILLLRPDATFWYTDPFNGEVKDFKSLKEAETAAKKEHGNSTIWQLGPGDTNKIVKTIEGLDPLP